MQQDERRVSRIDVSQQQGERRDSGTEVSQQQDERRISRTEVSQHKLVDDVWIIVDGEVFDVTEFQHEHPGGVKVFRKVAGRDASKQFKQHHKMSTLHKYREQLSAGMLDEKPEEDDGRKHKFLSGMKSTLSR
jgi:cytochrome b involved in lipid metabolism